MGAKTGIEWTDHTFNPWIGCTKVSEGCKNCYAKTRDDRHMLGPLSHWGPGAPRHITSAANWKEPLAWAKRWRREGRRARVFCASQADIFEKEAPVEARRNLWKLIGETCDILDWQLLTKRPENITPVMCDDGLNDGFFELTRCWLGTSTENQPAADKRIPEILDVAAAVHFISAEPLLETVVLRPSWINPTRQNENPLSWVICGGESGPGARPMHPDWARSLRDQCAAAGVPFFFKQWGEWIEGDHGTPLRKIDTAIQSPPNDSTNCVISFKGHVPEREESMLVDIPYRWMSRIGKKAAGALLDGREWKQFPGDKR